MVGAPVRTVNGWLGTKNKPPELAYVLQICQELEVSADWLLFGERQAGMADIKSEGLRRRIVDGLREQRPYAGRSMAERVVPLPSILVATAVGWYLPELDKMLLPDYHRQRIAAIRKKVENFAAELPADLAAGLSTEERELRTQERRKQVRDLLLELEPVITRGLLRSPSETPAPPANEHNPEAVNGDSTGPGQ